MTLEEVKLDLERMVPGFARLAAPLYKELGIEWGQKPHIPSVKELIDTLYSCISTLDKENQVISTGGVGAYYNPPKEKRKSSKYGLFFTFTKEKDSRGCIYNGDGLPILHRDVKRVSR